jgi:hypothetical protein
MISDKNQKKTKNDSAAFKNPFHVIMFPNQLTTEMNHSMLPFPPRRPNKKKPTHSNGNNACTAFT